MNRRRWHGPGAHGPHGAPSADHGVGEAAHGPGDHPWHHGPPWAHGPHGPPPWARGPHAFHYAMMRRRAMARGLPGYVRARLHRRLFAWFGAAIVLSTVLVVSLASLLDSRHGALGHALPIAITVLVLWGASGKIARRLARPLVDVAHVAEEIGRGNLSSRARLDCRTPDEVGTLAESINDMAARIERQLEDQRVLLAAVSHELRTPLGHLRVLVELLRASAGDASKKTVDDIEREVVEIDTLVGELLASSRLDFTALVPKPLDAIDLAARALERAGLDVSLLTATGAEAGAPFEGDPTLLARALANLLDNAKKHGGGAVALKVAVEETAIRFEVDDEGGGFPDGDAERAFEPFYRGLEVEERSPNGTLGLGLSLVKRIAEAHGGRAYAMTREEGGARVGLELPRHPSEVERSAP